MKKNMFGLLTIIIVASILITTTASAEDEYLKIIGKVVNIRTGASSKTSIVAKARRGDIFKLRGEKGKWYKILIISGEYRYVYKSLCRKTKYQIVLPSSVSTRRSISKALDRAEDEAQAEADRKYSVTEEYRNPGIIERNIDYMRLLNDRYQLEVCHKFGIQSPIASKLYSLE